MLIKTIINPKNSPVPVGPYSHAIRVGDLLFCSGQIPIDPKDGGIVVGDIKAQTERVLQNVKAILDDQALTFASVVKSTVFLTSPKISVFESRNSDDRRVGCFCGKVCRTSMKT